jgi:hypothetical protein
VATIKVFIKNHSVLTYYVLVFVISWGGVLAVIGGPRGIPGDPAQFLKMLPVLLLAMLAGPAVSGLLLTGLVDGRTGLRDLFSQLSRWRVSVRWYALALLTAPLLFTAIPLAISLLFPKFLPGIFATADKVPLLAMGMAAGLSTLYNLDGAPAMTPRLELLANATVH